MWRPFKGTPPGRREFEPPVMAGVTLYITWELEARFGGWEIVWTACEGHLANLIASTAALACNRPGPKAKSVLLEAMYIGPYALKVTARFYVCSAHTGRCRAQNRTGTGLRMGLVGCEQALDAHHQGFSGRNHTPLRRCAKFGEIPTTS